jgi:peptidoglycan/xylan/chitin deacetylase (PgdA/CDA1 family)
MKLLICALLCALSTSAFADCIPSRTTDHASLRLAPKEVVITFDDGPSSKLTPRLLDTLSQYCVKATFFLVGEMVERGNASIVRREIAEGHSIGNHTYSHKILTRTSYDIAVYQILHAEAIITAAAGHRPRMFRFPGLATTKPVATFLHNHGYSIYNVDVDSDDWKGGTVGQILARTLDRLHRAGKGIILFHDIHAKTIALMPAFLATLKREGYTVVHVT